MTVIRLFTRPDYGRSAGDQLRKKGVLALITRLAPGVATFVANILIGRIGGSALLGATQTVLSAASLGALAYPAGPAASRYVASLGAQGRTGAAQAVAAYLARRVMLISLVVATAAGGIATLIMAVSPAAAVMIGVTIVAVSGRAFVEGLHFGGGEGGRLAQWSLVIAGLSSVLLVGLLGAGMREVWVLAPLAALNLLFVATSWPRRSVKAVEPELAREIRRFIALSIAGSLTSTGFAQAAVLFAGIAQSLAFVGQYAAAMTLTTPLGLAASAVSAVMFPALAAAHGAKAETVVADRLRISTSLMTTLMVGAYIPMMLLSSGIIELVWGGSFQQAQEIILFLLPAVAVSTIAVPAVSAVTAGSNRGMAVSAVSSAAGATVGVTIWIVVTVAGWEYAVPLGFMVGTLVIAVIPYSIAWRRGGMSWAFESVQVAGGLLLPLVAVLLIRDLRGDDLLLSIAATAALLGCWGVLRRRSIKDIMRGLRVR